MRILAMADIHGHFDRFDLEKLPDADVIIIAGDITELGMRRPWEMNHARCWMQQLTEHAPVFWIPGNHDLEITPWSFRTPNQHCIDQELCLLAESPILTGYGVNMSPCYNIPSIAGFWRGMTVRSEDECSAFAGIPEGTDIIVSHCPPLGVLDTAADGTHIGSAALYDKIVEVRPKLVICGHVHESPGKAMVGDTWVYNVAQSWAVIDTDRLCNVS